MSSSPEAGTSGGGAAVAEPDKEVPPPTPQPPEVGARVLWRRDGQLIPAEIVERRAIPGGGGGGEYEYYVHRTDSDGSLGAWVKSEQLDLGSEGTDADEQTDDMGHEEFDTACVRQCLGIIRTKRIVKIGLDGHEIDMPPRSSFLDNNNSKLYVCEFCLDFKEQKGHLKRHMESCHLRHPPGTEIYKNDNLSVFEVDGKEEVYTRKLCMLANLFVPNKAPEPAVEYFLFYVLCEYDDQGYHMAAYFSKNKHVEQNCNLSCNLTFPPFRQKGYATFLIELS